MLMIIYMHCVGDIVLLYKVYPCTTQVVGICNLCLDQYLQYTGCMHPTAKSHWFSRSIFTRKMGSSCLENMRVLGSRPLHMRPWFRMRSLYVRESLRFRLRNTLYSHKDALQENHGAQDAVPDCVNVTHWPFLESTGTPSVCFVSTMIEQIFGKVLKMCQLDSEGFCPKWVKATQKRCYFCEWNERNQWTDFWQIWMLSSWGFVMVTESCCNYLDIYNEMSLYSILVADVQI